MDKLLAIAQYKYPFCYVILIFVIISLATIYWAICFVHTRHESIFTNKVLEWVSAKLYIILPISLAILSLSLILPFTGYPKHFKIVVLDNFKKEVTGFTIYKDGKALDSASNSIWLNNTNLPVNIKTDYLALSDFKEVDIDYYIKNDSIIFALDRNANNVSFNNKQIGFKPAPNKKIEFDEGGADLYTTDNSIENYLIIDNSSPDELNRYEMRLNASIYDPKASVTLEIGGYLRILFGEGNLKTLKVETNLSRKPNEWNKHSVYELEYEVLPSDPFAISVTIKNDISSKCDVIINFYYGKYASKSFTINSAPVSLSKPSSYKIGCINRNKSKSVRLIDLEFSSNKPRK